MAVELRAPAGWQNSLAINSPAGAQSGDLLVAVVTTNGSGTISPPDGTWTQRAQVNLSSGSATSLAVFTKLLSGSPAGSYTFTSSNSAICCNIFALFEPSGATVTFDVAATNNGTSATLSTSAVTPNSGNADPWERVLAVYLQRNIIPTLTPQHYGTYLGNAVNGVQGGCCAISYAAATGSASYTPSASSSAGSGQFITAQLAFGVSTASTGAGRMMTRGAQLSLNSTTVTLPTDVTDHDLMLGFAWCSTSTPAIAPPGAWNQKAINTGGNSVCSNFAIRTASGDGGATYTWTNSGPNYQELVLIVFNMDSATVGPVYDASAVQNNTSSSSPTSPTITVGQNNALVASFCSENGNSSDTAPVGSADAWFCDIKALNSTTNFGGSGNPIESMGTFYYQSSSGGSTQKTFSLSGAVTSASAQVSVYVVAAAGATVPVPALLTKSRLASDEPAEEQGRRSYALLSAITTKAAIVTPASAPTIISRSAPKPELVVVERVYRIAPGILAAIASGGHSSITGKAQSLVIILE